MKFIYYIPIITTLFSVYFFIEIFNHWKEKKKHIYLLWWTFGVVAYGLGTLFESLYTIVGYSEYLFKSWYVAGALLGGVPLAQGTVHLLMKEKTAKTLTLLLIIILIISSILVFSSPIIEENINPTKPTGDLLAWSWVRLITPFINIYAFLFLVGGAIYSAIKYKKESQLKSRMWGNIWIAVGGILPGIGGSLTKFGHTEALYVTELVGIIFIYLGYKIIKQDRSYSIHKNQL